MALEINNWIEETIDLEFCNQTAVIREIPDSLQCCKNFVPIAVPEQCLSWTIHIG